MTDLCIELLRGPNEKIPSGLTTFRNRYLQLPPRIPQMLWPVLLDLLSGPPLDWDKLEAAYRVPEALVSGMALPLGDED